LLTLADEFAQTASYLGAEMMITADVGKGSAPEAAAWLSYYKSRGVTPKYWEIGNEVYYPGNLYPIGFPPLDEVHLTAMQYAAAFDAYASALRAVDPTVQVGMAGIHGGAGGLDTWNQTVFQNVHQKIDFIAIHNSYAPQDASNDNSAGLYQAMLAYPLTVRSNLDRVEQDIAAYAQTLSRNMLIAITEHAALFTPPANISDANINVNDLSRSQSLAGALYSALLFNIYAKDPAVQITNHINPLSPYFQALLHVQIPNIPGFPGYDSTRPPYPQGYKPNPVQSAYFHIFRLYADAGRGTILTTGLTNSPTFDSPAINTGSGLPAQTNVPSLDAMAVLMPALASRLFVYVVNRDLARSIPAAVVLKHVSTQVQLTGGRSS
jgi:alpha-L-arabinofuranosidase